MLKGARLAFSRPGIIAGRQPGPSRPSPGSQAGPDSENGQLENAKSASLDMPPRSGANNLDRSAFGPDTDDMPAPGPKPPTPKRERYLPSFSRSPLRPRQPSPTPAPQPQPPTPAPRDPSPDSWQASPEPDRPRRRHRRHRSSKDGSKHKRHRRHRSSRAEPSLSPEPEPQEAHPEQSTRRKQRSSKHRSHERMQDEPLRREHSGYDNFNRRPPQQMMGPPGRERWKQEGYMGDGGPPRAGRAPAPTPPISSQANTARAAPAPAARNVPVAAAPVPAAAPVRPTALDSYSSDDSGLDLPDAEALANGKGMRLPSVSSSDEEDDLVGLLLQRRPTAPSAQPAAAPPAVSAQALQLAAAPLPPTAAPEDQRVRARQPRTYAAHLHEDTSPSAQHQAPRGMQAGRYERPLPPKEQHWNGNPAGDGGEGREGHEDRRERKSRKKQKKEKLKEKLKKHHRREQGKERRRRRGGSADDSPMHVGPSGHKGQPPRDDGKFGRGRYFQHDDRQAEAADNTYSDGYEGPSFFKREERQQRQRRRYESGDERSRSPPRRHRRGRSDSRSPSQDGRASKRRRGSRGRSPSRQPDVASAAIEAAKAAAAAAAQKAVNEQQLQLTRPARRVYVGALPLGTSEVELIQVFTHVMGASGGINHALGAGPVVTSCYMNMEKRFAFVEFRSIEEATNALALDGVSFRGEQLKVRRPADYNPTAPGLLSQPSNQPILASAISAATQPTATGHASLMPPSAFSQAPSPAPMPPMGPGTPATAGGLPLQSTAQPTTGLGGVAPNLPQQNGLGATHSAGAGQLPGGTGPNDVSMSSRQVPTSETNPSAAAAGEGPAVTRTLSNVLRLANMVTRHELADEEEYDDIVDDIREEIEDKYGTLRSVIVPKPAPGGPTEDPPGVGLVFVDFQEQAAARKAQSVLNGRMFADRTVQASFFDQAAFDAQELG
ncbi:hypothetical protein WJX84_003127 [Apatococcus fuscideae]|uniref:RRM domain-containing protein n=1 Tax=Apatococcus fuscideae TaxID=2026836 RepID=A0AAW1SRP5_9CHLO